MLQPDGERLVAHRLHFDDHLGGLLAEAVALGPALERGDAVRRAHRLAVMELQPVAQGDGVEEPVLADLVLVCHLRLHFEVLVDGEQRVVHHVAVVAGDVRRRPNRIEHAQVGFGYEAERLTGLRRRISGRQRSRKAGDCRELEHRSQNLPHDWIPSPIPWHRECRRNPRARSRALKAQGPGGGKPRHRTCRLVRPWLLADSAEERCKEQEWLTIWF